MNIRKTVTKGLELARMLVVLILVTILGISIAEKIIDIQAAYHSGSAGLGEMLFISIVAILLIIFLGFLWTALWAKILYTVRYH